MRRPRSVLLVGWLFLALCGAGCAGPEPAADVVWRFETFPRRLWHGDCLATAPAIHGGRLFYCGGYSSERQGHLYALDPRTGREHWRRPLRSGCGPLLFDGDRVYLYSPPELAALDTRTGREHWRWEGANGAPTLREGLLYVPAFPDDRRLVALDARSGSEVWTLAAKGRVVRGFLVEGEDLYFGTLEGYLYSVNRRTRQVNFAVKVAGKFTSEPAMAGGMLFFGVEEAEGQSRRYCLYAFDVGSRRLTWRYKTRDSMARAPFVHGGIVLVLGGFTDHFVRAVAIATGDEVWKVPVHGVPEPPVAAGGVAYLGSGKYLHAIDLRSGASVWKVRVADDWLKTPLLAGDVVYAGSIDCSLYAVRVPARGG